MSPDIPYFSIKFVGPRGEKIVGCDSYTVSDPCGFVSITAHGREQVTLSIPRDGITVYVASGLTGDTIDKYPRRLKKNKEGQSSNE